MDKSLHQDAVLPPEDFGWLQFVPFGFSFAAASATIRTQLAVGSPARLAAVAMMAACSGVTLISSLACFMPVIYLLLTSCQEKPYRINMLCLVGLSNHRRDSTLPS
jgi:hypothetical protein